MILRDEKENVEKLIDHVDEYLETQKELGKLVAAEKTGRVFSSLISGLILFAIFSIAIVFASITAAWLISEYYGKVYAGFIAVTLFYVLLGIILFVKRESWLNTPLLNAFIKNFFKNDNNG